MEVRMDSKKGPVVYGIDPVLAEIDGTVSKVSVSVGDVIQAGDLIAVIS